MPGEVRRLSTERLPLRGKAGAVTRQDYAPAVPLRHQADPRVLYICGWGRSGTTIVDRVLGAVPGFVSVGELRSLWDADPTVQRCGCGAAVARCPLWGPILSSMSAASGYTPRTVLSMRDEVARSRHLLRLRWAAHHPRRTIPPVASYGDVLEGIYRVVLASTGSGIVIDSSKHPAEALLLAGRPNVDLTVLHLVRDPRGVAYSWNRGGSEAVPAGGSGDRPPRRGAVSSSAWWTAWNGATEALIRPLLGSRYISLRYEDVMADPRQQLGNVIQRLGGSIADLPLVNGNEIVLGPSHTVAGNPSRMRTGPMHLATDRQWETKMTSADTWRATLPAIPLMRYYGYAFRRPAAPPSPS
jgi:hypothetical protein